MTPLHWAAKNGQTEIVKLLLQLPKEKGIDPNARDGLDMTPLHWAVENGHTQIVELLLQHGADPNATNTVLHLAAYKGHTQIVKLLLQHGADPNATNKVFKALRLAAQEGHAQIVKLLLQHGADVNATNTALHQAAIGGRTQIVELLLQHGADVNATNTALRLAAQEGHTKIVELLLEKGADPNATDALDRTPLHLAAQKATAATLAAFTASSFASATAASAAAAAAWENLILLAAYGHRLNQENTHSDIQAIIAEKPNMPKKVKATLRWITRQPDDCLDHQTLVLAEKKLAQMRPNTGPLPLIKSKRKERFVPEWAEMSLEAFLGESGACDKTLSHLHYECKQDLDKAKAKAATIMQRGLRKKPAAGEEPPHAAEGGGGAKTPHAAEEGGGAKTPGKT